MIEKKVSRKQEGIPQNKVEIKRGRGKKNPPSHCVLCVFFVLTTYVFWFIYLFFCRSWSDSASFFLEKRGQRLASDRETVVDPTPSFLSNYLVNINK